ncbi:MAG: hypothetical protein AB2A00_24115 [Myxococcota bacterium]
MLATLLTVQAATVSSPISQARTALRKKDWAGARKALQESLGSSVTSEKLDALMLMAEADVGERKLERAHARWREALILADEGANVSKDRARVLKRMSLATGAGAARVQEQVKALKAADTVVAGTARWPLLPTVGEGLAPGRAELEAAVQAYGDAGQKRRASSAKGALAVFLAVQGDRNALQLTREAASLCHGRKTVAPTTPEPCRVQALTASVRVRTLLAGEGEAAGKALGAALKEARELDELLAGERKDDPYRRGTLTALVCARMDVVAGEGACRRAESALGLPPTFRDFSTGKPAPVLTNDAVALTHAEYAFLLSRCLRAAAREDVELQGERVELSWVVQPEGRVDEITMEPRRLREHRAGMCLKEALGLFRYPRYQSQERRVIALALQISG